MKARFVRRRKRGVPGVGRLVADIALASAMLATLALLGARSGWLAPDVVSGVARVVDGDTLVIDGTRVRLAGIDAPEIGQTCQRRTGVYDCGKAAQAALERLIGGRVVTCRGGDEDRYGRFLGYCQAGNADLNRAMVSGGWAVAYGDYRGAEREARGSARGVWAGDFERPGEWRRIHGGRVEDEHGGVFARMFGFSFWRYFQ